jgi:hypothetical protein
MKKIAKRVRCHAEKHLALLKKNFEKTKYSEKQAQLIMKRMQDCLDKLPEAVRQAHERIIGGRQVKNGDKILSLYEDDVHVMIRGKANAEVEFWNYLLLGEQRDGLLVFYDLVKEGIGSDPKCLQIAQEYMLQEFGESANGALSGDRGFDGPQIRDFCDEHEIFNAVARRSPSAMEEKLKEPRFCELNRRRTSTEGRIGIFQNCFLGRCGNEIRLDCHAAAAASASAS